MKLDNAFKIDGWMSNEECQWLAEQASTRKNILEIGSWTGKSSRALGDNTLGKVTCVDTWVCSDALNGTLAENMPDTLKPINSAPGDWVYDTFRKNMKGILGTKVLMLRMHSSEALKELSRVKFDMIFIDGDHTYEGVKADIQACLPLLAPGGLICGHDYNVQHTDSVNRAVHELVPGGRAVGVRDLWSNKPTTATCGTIWGMPWDDVGNYAHSLVQTGYTGPKIMFVSDRLSEPYRSKESPMSFSDHTMDKASFAKLRNNLTNLGFTVIPWTPRNRGLNPITTRWEPLLDYYKTHPIPDWLVVTDVKDCVFQRNPFPWLEEHNLDFVGAGESVLVGEERTHDGFSEDFSWCVAAVGREAAESVADQEVCCHGTLTGRGAIVLQYVEALCAALAKHPNPKIIDQGLGHWLMRQPPFKDLLTIPRLSEAFINSTNFSFNSGMDPAFRMIDGVAYPGDSDTPFRILHCCRHPRIYPLVREKYFTPTNICKRCGSRAFIKGMWGPRCRGCGHHFPLN